MASVFGRGVKHLARKNTGLVGLRKVGDPHAVLASVYSKTLEIVGQMPKDAAYRKNVEVLTNDRLSAVNSISDIDELETAINAGQIEEVIVQAEDELSLAGKMIEWKPWEKLEEAPLADQWQFP